MQIKPATKEMLLGTTTPQEQMGEYVDISPEELETFPDSPFRLYTDVRRDKLLESIQANGILQPLLVWRCDGHPYILSGGNRASCARQLGLKTVPCIVQEHLTKAQATMILVDTNFAQRSLFELLPSEKAWAFRMQLEAYQTEHKKLDYSEDIEALKSADKSSNDAAFENVVTKLQRTSARDKVADDYSLSGVTIFQYIRLTYLIKELMGMVDRGEIQLKAGVALSYLPEIIQRSLFHLQRYNKIKLNLETAMQLKQEYQNGKLSQDNLEAVVNQPKPAKKSGSISIKLPAEIIDRYFPDRRKRKEIARHLENGLDIYTKVSETVSKYEPDIQPPELVDTVLKALELYYQQGQ